MSYQTHQYSDSHKINLDLENDDEFEEFEQDNWSIQQNEVELWDENWDEINIVDEDLANYLNNVKQNS